MSFGASRARLERLFAIDGRSRSRNRSILLSVASIALALLHPGQGRAASDQIRAVGIENEYADVISQIGGRSVRVQAVVTDPNTDPHTFEASPKIASELASAQLVVENGIGYDSWADRILTAANSKTKVIDVQRLMNLPDSTPNPHLWYDPKTMPVVAKAIAAALSEIAPDHAQEYQANERKFEASLRPWSDEISSFKARFGQTPVAVTEPVADYMLEAAGCRILTPVSLQVAIMNGTDPSPQDVALQNQLFDTRRAKVFLYNQQVTDALTQSFLARAKKNGVPVVGVYETMPTPGFDYQNWMEAEVGALRKAVTDRSSTETLGAPQK